MEEKVLAQSKVDLKTQLLLLSAFSLPILIIGSVMFGEENGGGVGFFFAMLICFAGLCAILGYLLKNVEIIVTDKRVYGVTFPKNQVDLPIDKISSVSTATMKSVAVATSSGIIRFKWLKNKDEVYEAISGLLAERQHKQAAVQEKSVVVNNTSNADELKKYKDLADSGVITQQEFEDKKRQLLGL